MRKGARIRVCRRILVPAGYISLSSAGGARTPVTARRREDENLSGFSPIWLREERYPRSAIAYRCHLCVCTERCCASRCRSCCCCCCRCCCPHHDESHLPDRSASFCRTEFNASTQSHSQHPSRTNNQTHTSTHANDTTSRMNRRGHFLPSQ